MQEIETLIVNGVKFRLKDTESRREGLTEGSSAFGDGNYAGLRGYYMKALDIGNGVIELAETQQVPVAGGDHSLPAEVQPPYAAGDVFSIVNGTHYDLCGVIETIDENGRIWVKEPFPFDSVAQVAEPDYFDYTFAVPAKPELGAVQVTKYACAFGVGNKAAGVGAFSEGRDNLGVGNYSHTEGRGNEAHYSAHAEGRQNKARGTYSHAEGQRNEAEGIASHAEGYRSRAEGVYSHSEGSNTKATGEVSHAEGYSCTASGKHSHAEGNGARADSSAAHAEGTGCIASGWSSHGEGLNSSASGDASHAEGLNCQASGECAHAEGRETYAPGHRSHTEGLGTCAYGDHSHVQGKYNIADLKNKYAHIVGNGNGDTSRSNAHTIDWKGNGAFSGAVTSTTGADYAEYFEWQDGNPDGEDRVGYAVALDGERIRLATVEDTDILGIVSGTAAVIGDTAQWEWSGKYLTDDFGRPVTEQVEQFIVKLDPQTGEDTQVSIGFAPMSVINPDYDQDRAYIPREDRPEWATIGMLGKLYARDDGTCKVNGYAKTGENGKLTLSQEKTNIRVLSRNAENVIRVLFK